MKREIVLDTETTGLDPKSGHRLVEIAALELVNHVPTGKHYHVYINPGRDMPEQAFKVHGLSADFLKDFSCFDKIYQEFVDFIQADTLVIHNAPFDMGFLNFELEAVNATSLNNPVVDTLKLARGMFPGSPASLDALCRRYKIDLSGREKHGALIDCELLAAVYLEMLGGRQQGLGFLTSDKPALAKTQAEAGATLLSHYKNRPFQEARAFPVSEAELAAHTAFIDEKIKKKPV
ncbi:MAG: DNA polymerase III subunit epsilon [Holosporaceae bacterium]|nr:MAG: DNA polymerase III subunit epsilon [Holosporaceae bacterium]